VVLLSGAATESAGDEDIDLPPISDNAFYSAIFERGLPRQHARARFIDEELWGHTPHLGHHQLAAVVAAGHAQCC
jgi:hypothetical protein